MIKRTVMTVLAICHAGAALAQDHSDTAFAVVCDRVLDGSPVGGGGLGRSSDPGQAMSSAVAMCSANSRGLATCCNARFAIKIEGLGQFDTACVAGVAAVAAPQPAETSSKVNKVFFAYRGYGDLWPAIQEAEARCEDYLRGDDEARYCVRALERCG